MAPEPGQRFLEVGPGRGALTLPLLAAGVRLLAVEIDPALVRRLRSLRGPETGLTVVEGDILQAPLADLLDRELPPGREVRVAGNLPYSVASPVILRLLALSERFRDLTFMVQREVADRILAAPGGRDYGVLTLLCAYRARARRLLDLPPGCFSPPPEVSSTLLRFVPAAPEAPPPGGFDAFEKTVKAAFSGRRKTLRNSLAAGCRRDPREVEEWLRRAKLEPGLRPEQISLEGYLDLARSGSER